uniref:Uncharacterized protein n=1 Tax=Sinocyclocheilus grahami TaxID=75366 RepID=A0A672SHL2_SINGR
IPIWSVTCCHISLILMMRSAMSFTSTSLREKQIFSWDSTRLASSASLQTTVKPPTRSPEDTKVQTKDWDRRTLSSRSMSPLANPW